jgi:hypothetical protein
LVASVGKRTLGVVFDGNDDVCVAEEMDDFRRTDVCLETSSWFFDIWSKRSFGGCSSSISCCSLTKRYG